MWLMTTFGFFSVVQKPGEADLTVRARVRSDLDELRATYLPALTKTVESKTNDYRYRANVSHAALGAAMGKIVADITYSNFKSAVEDRQGLPRELVYADVWSVLNKGLPPLDVAKQTSSHRASKFGGVVIDDGRVLLRRPRGDFDGYVWTFAKGDRDHGESPEETALREVLEETGVTARILCPIPGTFRGGTGTVEYFLMERIETRALPANHAETSDVRWASHAEAKQLIGLTSNSVGRERDLAVLDAAIRTYQGVVNAAPKLARPKAEESR